MSRTGARKWRLRFTIHGKRREMGLGSFADVGLAEARECATEYRKQVERGLDPIVPRRIRPAAPIFTACAGPLCPGTPAWLDERQACPAVGEHP